MMMAVSGMQVMMMRRMEEVVRCSSLITRESTTNRLRHKLNIWKMGPHLKQSQDLEKQ
jgi:hypothetical protein